jgi:hypothetical protein
VTETAAASVDPVVVPVLLTPCLLAQRASHSLCFSISCRRPHRHAILRFAAAGAVVAVGAVVVVAAGVAFDNAMRVDQQRKKARGQGG